MLALLQRGLEELYRLEPAPDVRGFLIDEERRTRIQPDRTPPEQLLCYQNEHGELEVGLFLDPRCLANLDRNDPRSGLGDHNFADLCLAVEGVSHFLFLLFHAGADIPLRGLELELQAEIDKYVTCVLLAEGPSALDVRHRLFSHFRFADALSTEERDRYHAANEKAGHYARRLERLFVRSNRIPDMLAELRRFYRMTWPEKLGWIAATAG